MDLPIPKRREIDSHSISKASSSLTRSCPYDVFLSFRGADARKNFTGHLYTDLVQKGINTFIDDEELRKGEEISYSLLQPIQGSKISVVMFSENYASSSWCLDELVEIVKCKELKQQLVCPVFFKVDPCDVRHLKGKYGEAFAKHECRFKDDMEKVQRWRTAFRDAANLSGWTFVDGHEASFISNIAEQISAQVAKHSYLNVAKYPVGIESRVQDVRPKFVITSWEKGDLLGSGSFGSVYEGISDGGRFIAIKEVSLLDQGTLGRQRVTQLEQEIALLSQFEHENIVQYYGTQKDESKLYIFLELVTKGSLQKLYETYHLIDSYVSLYTRQILQGLKYLHEQNVIHRDIKCANILVHANGSVKLADFGLAKISRLNDIKSFKGTAYWMAPEVVNRSSQGYGLLADIWSLGCTVLEMSTGQIPYFDLEWMSAVWKIGNGELPLVPENLSKEAQDFIHLCLQVKPDDRPTAAQLLTHPFVNKSLPPTPSGSVSPYIQHRQS